MMERIAETSPRLKARITGVFYLLAMLSFAKGNDYEHSSDEAQDCRCFLLAHHKFLSGKNLI
jgi:hypothetical protein